ncbi:MAG TPA: MurR/RpiR family transcriptional regulator [Anaerovoracaceae bacterium]|nr:MurR/RpiR family transcriptional regulator [Anaerovoracaceae bacterium]
MDNRHEKTVIETIRENYHQIFLAEKKVADFILENPEKAVNANVSELANYSGVSDATVIRLCKHIGYDGYYQLKICLSRDLGRMQVTDTDMDNTAEDKVSRLLGSYASGLTAIGKNLDDNKMLECVNLIKTCKQVHIVAVGNTSPLAQYMGFRLGRLGIKCTYNMVPEYFMNHVNLADADDLIIAISQSGSSKQVVQAMELAKEKGLKIIAITGHECSPVSRLADHLLLSGADEQPFNYYKSYSRLRETAVIDALLHFVTNEETIAANKADIPEIILSEYKL